MSMAATLSARCRPSTVAASDGAEDVGFFVHGRHCDAACGERLFGFGYEHFGH